jgi:hypothetical protein
MADNLPSRRIDRAALEKIIQRATELQAGELDTGESMTETELLKLGSDVGIDGRYLRQALYEQGSGTSAETGFWVRWFGPQRVNAGRVVPGSKADVETTLGHWMTEGEALTVKRRLPDRTVWEKQKGFFAEMKRGFGVGGKNYHLARALDVTVVVTQLEEGFCHVELTADIATLRQGAVGASVGGGAAMLLIGGGTIALTTLTVVPLAVVASLGFVLVAAAGAAPVVAGRVQRTRAGRMQLALEQVLDRLEHGEIRPRHRAERGGLDDLGSLLMGRVTAQVRQALKDPLERNRLPSGPRSPGER